MITNGVTGRKLFILSYWTYNDTKSFVGALRPYRMYEFFKKKGWQVELITPRSSNGTETVVSESQWMRSGLSRAFPPDYTLFWALKLLWKLRSKIKKQLPCYFLTTCPPNGLIIAGLLGKLFFGSKLVWVLDFRDLWTHHPLYAPPFTKKFLDPLLEHLAVRNANLILCNTLRDYDYWSARFPRSSARMTTITNGFDSLLPNVSVPFNDHLRFVYTGGTTAGQATRWVHALLSQFQAEGIDAYCDFYGEFDCFMAESPWIEYKGIVSPEEVPQLLTNYRYGFIYLPKGSEAGGRIAQKLYDYLGSGVIPVCYRPSQEMRRLIHDLHTGVCINEEDPIEAVIGKIAVAQFRASPDQLHNLTRFAQFDKMYEVLLQLS